ncbi:MAG TPA: hypothetical protein VJA47_06320 [archaeon]|nr:hypothetical protein [archaeon]
MEERQGWKGTLMDVGYVLGFMAALAVAPRVCRPEIYKARPAQSATVENDRCPVTFGLYTEEIEKIKDFKVNGKARNGGWKLEPKREPEEIFFPGQGWAMEPEPDYTISNGKTRISHYGKGMRLDDDGN